MNKNMINLVLFTFFLLFIALTEVKTPNEMSIRELKVASLKVKRLPIRN